MKLYKQSETRRIRLLGQRFISHGREARPLEPVVMTWWISFDHIKTEDPRAANSTIMYFFDQQGILFALLIADDEDEFDSKRLEY